MYNLFYVGMACMFGVFCVIGISAMVSAFSNISKSVSEAMKARLDFREKLAQMKAEQAQRIADEQQKASSKVAKILPFARQSATPTVADKTEPTPVPVAEPAKTQTQTASSATPSAEQQIHAYMASWLRENTEFDGQKVFIKPEAFEDMISKGKAAANSQKTRGARGNGKNRGKNGAGTTAGNDPADQQDDQQ